MQRLTNSSQPALQNTSQPITTFESHCEVSIYKEEKPTADVLAWAVKTLRACYPETDVLVFDILLERFKANNWGNDKIKDSINHLIENHVYKTINPANVLRFDRQKKLYTYNQLLNMVNTGDKFDKYKRIEVNGKAYWERQ
jgi:hypothetical protein